MTERVRLTSALLGATLAYARTRGVDTSTLTAGLDLPPPGDKGGLPLVSARQAREVLDGVEAALDDPMLGVHVAQSLERGAYGVVEFACRTAPDMRGALERVSRFIALVSAPAVAELDETEAVKGGATLRFRFPAVRGTLGRQGNEFFAALILLRARELTGTALRPVHVAFEHPAPAIRKEVEAFFELSPVGFGAEWNEIGFDATTVALPILSHEPHLLPLLDKMAEEAVAARGVSQGLVDDVANHIRGSLERGEPSLDDVAKALGMSGRTLQRRLNDEETPFAEVVDSVRNELARLYVREPERSLDAVASLLGYAGSRPFQRAFKRWTGMTPLEYRRAHSPSRP